MENKDFEMTEMNKPKEQKIEKWKIPVLYNELIPGEDYYVHMWTNNHSPLSTRVQPGHTHKAIAKKL